MSDLRAAFYGDDFTGSVDALLQFARRGWTGRLFVGMPSDGDLRAAAAACDVVGIAGIARSLPTAAMDAELRPVLSQLAALDAPIVQYKASSTADSSPDLGSLGRVIELGRELVSDATIPVLFAQPDFGRYTAFGTHFAAEDGTVHRLDRQPTMSTHPSTPMTEADLAVHLSRQTELPVASLAYPEYRSPDAIAAALQSADAAAVVLDALGDAHLEIIGAALHTLPAPVFAIGSGGLSLALAAASPGVGPELPVAAGAPGPVLVVSGSRSLRTRRQADAAAAAGWLVRPLVLSPELHADAGSDVTASDGDVVAALAAGRSVVLTSDDADISSVAAGAVLEAIAQRAASVVDTALRAGVTRRVIVCGGDTSSRITRLLGVTSLSIAANPWANVVLLRAHADDPAIDGAELLLKGGQVGDADLFERIRALGG